MPQHEWLDEERAWYQRVYDWLERRVQLEGPIKDAVLHPVPRSTASWWYVFGSASLTLLILLRVYVVIAIPIVCYAFIHAIMTSQ